jgi:predicted  nucleic acid-binding Zn-ribbon protein
MKVTLKNTSLLILLTLTTSCANPITKAVDKAKYSAYEAVGMEKRDIFKREVANVKEDQQETGEAFKDALTQLKEIYNFDGGNLEKQHGKLKASLDDAKDESADLSKRIDKMDKVANDLFAEWQTEIAEIKTSELQERSSKQLRATKSKYQTLEAQLRSAEKKMAPVLAKLNDQVLFLKHNLNAEAIGGLKIESGKIQADIKSLIKEVDESTRQADALIKTL